MDIKLTVDEIEVLKLVLSDIVIQDRTGQIGVMHGVDCFVSLHIVSHVL